jgi:lysophospholipase L1-like esterase
MKTSLTILLFTFTNLFLTACNKDKRDTNTVLTGTGNVTTDSTQRTYLALGDSYTIGQSVNANERFPVQAMALLKQQGVHLTDPEIIATTGWTTGDLIRRLQTNPPIRQQYTVVTLLIGVNNQFQGRTQEEYRTQFTQLLTLAIQYAGNQPTHVVVLSIPDWGATPFANGYNKVQIAAEIDAFNLINKQISDQYKVGYIDITAISRKVATDPGLVANDGLHPSGKQYALWSDLLAAKLKAVL